MGRDARRSSLATGLRGNFGRRKGYGSKLRRKIRSGWVSVDILPVAPAVKRIAPRSFGYHQEGREGDSGVWAAQDLHNTRPGFAPWREPICSRIGLQPQ